MKLVYKIADNITSPLGDTTEANYQAVVAGKSAIRTYSGYSNLPFSFAASLFTDEQEKTMAVEGLTRFESMALASVMKAVRETDFDLSAPNVVFILSTTKANTAPGCPLPGESARRIARRAGIQTEPVVVCNACISGLSAIILAKRLLEMGCYDYAVVCGADSQSPFIVSGFQSLKALSDQPCRPFDMERLGLNLGEAAATIVLSTRPTHESHWTIVSGAVRNDACHISAPSRSGDGCYRALQAVLGNDDRQQIAFVNAHGTGTMFNDQMESVALERACLTDVPVNALKGYYGHTMGAAGVLETVLSMYALDNNMLIGTRGFSELGVSGHIRVAAENQPIGGKQQFVKILSGFGGCNAALRVERVRSLELGVRSCEYLASPETPKLPTPNSQLLTPNSHRVTITPRSVTVDGKPLYAEGEGKELLTDVYKRYIGNYPKFYKMDMLARLGFIGSELLLQAESTLNPSTPLQLSPRGGVAVILFNRTSSLNADRHFEASIQDADNFFPSPSVFVYTLPNIVTGEIAIRNNYVGETSFYVLAQRDDNLMEKIFKASMLDSATQSILGGWTDCENEEIFEADMYLIENIEK